MVIFGFGSWMVGIFLGGFIKGDGVVDLGGKGNCIFGLFFW